MPALLTRLSSRPRPAVQEDFSYTYTYTAYADEEEEDEPYVPKTQYGSRFSSYRKTTHRAAKKDRKPGSDLYHMLDPSYSGSGSGSTSSSSYSSRSAHTAYVDDDGYFHDPSYRLFEVVRPKRKRVLSDADTPFWDRDDEEVDEEEEDSSSSDRYSRRSSTYNPPRTRTYSSYSAFIPPPLPLAPAPTPAPAFVSEKLSSSPSSGRFFSRTTTRDSRWNDDVVIEETEADIVEVEDVTQRRRSKELYDDEEEEDPVREDCVPTCGDALRREWQSIVLSVTLNLFRAKRRLRQRFARRQ